MVSCRRFLSENRPNFPRPPPAVSILPDNERNSLSDVEIEETDADQIVTVEEEFAFSGHADPAELFQRMKKQDDADVRADAESPLIALSASLRPFTFDIDPEPAHDRLSLTPEGPTVSRARLFSSTFRAFGRA